MWSVNAEPFRAPGKKAQYTGNAVGVNLFRVTGAKLALAEMEERAYRAGTNLRRATGEINLFSRRST